MVKLELLIKADEEKLDKIKELYEDSKKIRSSGYCIAMYHHYLRQKIKFYFDSGFYNPKILEKLEKEIPRCLERSKF